MIFIAYVYTGRSGPLQTYLIKNKKWYGVDVYESYISTDCLLLYIGHDITKDNKVCFHDPDMRTLLFQCDNLPEFETWVKQYNIIYKL